MPLYSIQPLSPAAVLGLWHLTEPPEALWPLLPQAPAYRALMPPTADTTRQAQWLAGRVLIHRLLAGLPAPPPQALVRNDATGRPWLEAVPAGWALSLSHSGAWVAAVLATSGRVGVDVELVRDKAQRLARKFLSDEEQASALISGPSEAATHYTLLWSAKETLYKLAARRGLIFREHLRLESFEPHTQGEIPGALILNDIQTRHSICYCRPADGYVLTYCFETTA